MWKLGTRRGVITKGMNVREDRAKRSLGRYGAALLATALASAAQLAAGHATAAPNLVVNGDFSAGNSGFSSGYTLTTMTPFLFQNNVHGIYAVEAVSAIPGSAAYGDWTNISTDPTGGNGNVFAADAATVASTTVWSETVSVAPNTNYAFSFYGVELSNPCCSNATLQPSVNGVNGTTLDTTAAWQQSASFVWNSGANTSATLQLLDTNTSGGFNDFAIDDLSFSAVSAVPEPGTWALLLFGVGAIGVGLRTRRQLTATPA